MAVKELLSVQAVIKVDSLAVLHDYLSLLVLAEGPNAVTTSSSVVLDAKDVCIFSAALQLVFEQLQQLQSNILDLL